VRTEPGLLLSNRRSATPRDAPANPAGWANTDSSRPATPGGHRLVLRGGVLGDGTRVDVAIDSDLGVYHSVGVVDDQPGDQVERVDGMVLTPAPAEPHTHLDKVFLAVGSDVGRLGNGSDLAGAIATMGRAATRRTVDDVHARAVRGVEILVAHGVTALRTHVDVRDPIGADHVEVLARVRQWADTTGLADIQVVALVSPPITGSAGKANRRNLHLALEAGADLVGGCPYRDPDPRQATDWLLQTAVAAGVGIDLHTDETLDTEVLTVADLAELATCYQPVGGVTASHCVSLGMVPAAVQHQVAAKLAAANVAVVTLPQTNLFLQGRDHRSAVPRGLTALGALGDAGVTVAAGSDNTRDPFCTVGRLDPCETAALLVMAGHQSVHAAWQACTAGARAAMGLPATALQPGAAAELLAIDGADLLDAVASGSQRRLTIHRGRIVARTDVVRCVGSVADPSPAAT